MSPEVTLTDKPTITLTAAKKLDKKICVDLDSMEAFSLELYELLAEMRTTLGFKHLGFDSWPEYMTDRTSAYTHLKVTRAQLVWTLSDDGHSQDAIAEKLSVSRDTVHKDLKKRKANSPKNGELDKTAGQTTKGTGRTKAYPRNRAAPKPTARVRPESKGEKLLFCVEDDWGPAYKMLTGLLRNMLDNPTYEQLEQLEGSLRRNLVKVVKLKEAFHQ